MTDLLSSLKGFHFPDWDDSELLNVLDQPSKGCLVFKRSPTSKTYITHQYLEHPFHITRPFYLNQERPELATLYLQSSSGGLVQGDWLQFNLSLEPHAAVQFTTQAGTKVHSMERGFAMQKTFLQVKSKAYLEYLPKPLILFPHSRIISATKIELAASANLIFSESFICHNPHSSSPSQFDFFANELIISRENQPLVIDRFCINNLQPNAAPSDIFSQYNAQGIVFLVSQTRAAADLVSGLRDRLAEPSNSYIGISTLPHDSGAWIRILAANAHTLQTTLDKSWAACQDLRT